MSEQIEVLWLSSELQSAERCVVRPGLSTATIESTTLLPYGDMPARIDYTISIATGWETQEVRIALTAAGKRTALSLVRNRGWLVNGIPRPDLDACIDVDLGWTPATNMLPLRRIPLRERQSIQTIAAWVRFPELDVVPSEQTYTRVAHDRVRYRSSAFEAELVVTSDGLVTTYGNGLWKAAKLFRHP